MEFSRRGVVGPWANVEQMERVMWDDWRAIVLKQIETRKESGIPLINEATGAEIRDPGEYLPDIDQLKDIEVRIAKLARSELTEIVGSVNNAQSDEEALVSMRVLVSKCLKALRGLEEEGGAPFEISGQPTEQDLDALEDAMLIPALYGACRSWHNLSAEKKRLCLSPPLYRSGSSTVTHVAQDSGSSAVV